MKKIDPQTLAQKLKEHNHGVVVVDLRDSSKYKRGHIPGALNITMEKLAGTISKHAKKEDLIVAHCGGGTRGPRAYHFLETLGYNNIRCMEEGFRGWKKLGVKK